MLLYATIWVKDPFKVHTRLMDFNVMKYEKFIHKTSYFTLESLKNNNLQNFGVESKKNTYNCV